MKKIVLLLLTLCLAFGFASCDICDITNNGDEDAGKIIIRFLDPSGEALADDIVFSNPKDLLKLDISDMLLKSTAFDFVPEERVVIGWDNNGDGKVDESPLSAWKENETLVLVPVYGNGIGRDATYVDASGEATYAFHKNQFTYSYNGVLFKGTYHIVAEEDQRYIRCLVLEQATEDTPLTKVKEPFFIGEEEGMHFTISEDGSQIVISETVYTKIS